MLTTASCSFSHSRYSSAAVSGRGCLSGRPAASLLEITGERVTLAEAGMAGGPMTDCATVWL